MPRIKSKRKTWKTDLAQWARGVGSVSGYSTYVKQEFGHYYELEPISVGGRIFYQVAVTTDRRSPRVNFVTEDGGVSASPVVFKSASEAQRAAVRNYDALRRMKHHPHQLTHAFRTRFQRA